MLVKLTSGVSCTNMLRATFTYKSMCLQFVYVIFWQKETDTKTDPKMLMNLTPGVNFINILCDAFTRTDPKSGLTSFFA